jgi:hypothetical protein
MAKPESTARILMRTASAIALICVTPLVCAEDAHRLFPNFQTSEGTLYEIRGADHPELIPHHSLWGMFFKEVNTATKNKNVAFLRHMGMTDLSSEGGMALATAVDRQTAEAEGCQQRLRELVDRLTAEKASPKRARKETVAAIIRCRQQYVEAGEELMRGLGAEDRALVQERLEVIRHSISISVFAHDMKFFSLPR